MPTAAHADPPPAEIGSLLALPDQGTPTTSTDPDSLAAEQSADPGAQISLIDPPVPNEQGAARLAYPIQVPPGRNDSQPNLSITYDSSGADGWLGVGWDLSTQAIAVDTRWGVPRYDRSGESESYDFDGNELTPLAHRHVLLPRTAERTFHERVEGDFYTITRHGDSPTNYWWEVVDQDATHFYFGAQLRYVGGKLTASLDRSQVLESPNGIYKWPLTVVEDFDGNVTNYQYTSINDPVTAESSTTGSQLYLTRIDYDLHDTGDAIEPGAYSVELALTRYVSGTTPRPDVLTDARGGALEVTGRLLHSITVNYQGTMVRRYRLDYEQGEFAKTLLSSITEDDSQGHVFNRHEFHYYDNVKGDDHSYNGFARGSTWDTGSDHVANSAITGLEDPSALSGGFSNSYDGHIYLGFNPLEPEKDGSVGVNLDYNHVDSTDTLAMEDINGDGLPDKVFETGDEIKYRINQSGPDGGTVFGDAKPLATLDTLGQQSSNAVTVGPEAHIGVSLLYNHSWTFTDSSVYFIDVNNDGLPDLVHDGHVLFDHLVDGVPTFTSDSSTTRVPIRSSQVDAGALMPELKSIYQHELAASPLVDAVRRWVAPYAGTIAIAGRAAMEQAPPSSYDTADGVTVAIQHNGATVWSHHLAPDDTTGMTPPDSAVGDIHVDAGDRIYFRTESGYDGKYDAVAWDPTITYVGRSLSTADANGLPVYSFDAGRDFTVAGRQDMQVTMPFTGTVAFAGDLHKRPTSDDVTLELLDTGTGDNPLTTPTVLFSKTLLASQSGSIALPTAVHVDEGERLELHVAVASRIDLSRLQWEPSLYYTSGVTKDGGPLAVKDTEGHYQVQLNPPYSIDVYPRSTIASPDTGESLDPEKKQPVTPKTPATMNADAAVVKSPAQPTPLAGHPSGDIVFTVKTANRLLGKETMTVEKGLVTGCRVEDVLDASTRPCIHKAATGWEPISFDLGKDDTVFYDFSVADPRLSDDITQGMAGSHEVPVHGTYDAGDSDQDRITGKGLFAQPYRGWASATYNGGDTSADAPMDETRLVVDTSDYPNENDYYHPDLGSPGQNKDNTNDHPYPTQNYNPDQGFVGVGKSDPTQAKAWPLAPSPAHLDTLEDPPAQVPDQWLGNKDETWVRAGTMESSRLGQDYVSVPSAADFAGASAVTQVSEDQQDAIAADLAGLGGSFSWGSSDGLIDELDLNGDGFPDVVGNGSIQYTDSTGALDPSGTTPHGLTGDSVRQGHSTAWSFGLSGTAAKFSSDAKGNTNAPQQAQPSSGNARKPASSGSGAAEAEPEGAGRSNALASRPASSGGAVGSSDAAGEESAAAAPGEGSAVSRRGAGTSGAEPDGDPPEEESDGGSKLSLGVSGSYGQGSTNHSDDATGDLVNTDLVDVNGDGLPDRVSTDKGGTMKVAFNLGYSFADPVKWSDDAVTQKGSSASASGGASVGFNDGDFGVSGGVNGGLEADQDDGVLVDVNGDGLADYVTDRGGEMYVAVNTGDGFASSVVWHGAMTSSPVDGVDSQVSTSTSAHIGGGGYFTIGIPTCVIPPDFEPACYIIINPGFDYSRSMSRQELQIRDINGDGYPDDLSSTADDSVDVALNNTGTTNLLRTVDRPLGGSFTIDYQRKGNTTSAPASIWAMSKVTVHDNTPKPSAGTQVTTYSYRDNVYDPEERETYGFGTVTTDQVDPQTGKTYRRIVDTYANDDYYDHGLLTSETVEDGAGADQIRTENDYTLHDVDTGNDVPQAQAQSLGLDTIFPELSRTTQQYYWGQDTPGKTTSASYRYDAHGNPTRIADSGDGPQNAVTVDVTYTDCPDTNVFDVPTDITVTDSDGAVLRRQRASVPCDLGAPESISQYLADGSTADTEITYDDYYNVKSITYPADANHQSYEVDYAYDDATHTYVSGTTDSFGYASSATYDPRFGAIASTTDANDNTTHYEYDDQGRLASVWGPDQHVGGTPTISFEYHPCGYPCASLPWAEAHAVDPLHGGSLDTVTLVDGLDRTVQTKHDATVATGPQSAPDQVMVVSGRTVLDFLGRTIAQYYPTTEPLGAPGRFDPTMDSEPPAQNTFDVLDRLTRHVTPSGTVTSWVYDFGADHRGQTEFRTTATDPLHHKTVTYSDVRQQVTGVARMDGTTPVWTDYRYDPLNQLVSVTDDQGNTTKLTWDDLGRQTSVDSPDSGLTTMTYDLASHLVAEQTADERAAKKSPSTRFDYDYTHLAKISYPDDPGNDVTYTYGGPGAAHNGAGRVVKVVDQAGEQEYQYGRLGLVTNEADTVNAIHAQPQATYATAFEHDTWGRLHTLTYPDGEKLTYDYGFGGLVDAVAGADGNQTEQYVSGIQYDKFGHQVRQSDGNQTTTGYEYGPTNQLLTRITASGTDGTFQDQSYTYDKVGNVVGEKNSVPVPPASQYGGPSSQSFTYDDLYRLTGATGTYHYAPDDTRTYALSLTYDSLGDILTNHQTDTITEPGGSSQLQAATSHDWAYGYDGTQPNAVDQVAGGGTLSGQSNGKGSGHSPSSGTHYSYDPNGNQVGWTNDASHERRTLAWDDAGRLQSVTTNGQATRYRYDDQGNQVVSYGPGGVTTTVNPYYTVVNGSRIVKTVLVGSQRVAQRDVDPDLPGGSALYYYHGDLNGSTAYVTDSQGRLFEHLEYFATGAPWVDEVSDPHVIAHLYTSHPYSSVTQLSYYGARYYDPTLDQFISPDPAMQPSPAAAIDDPMALQPYSYVDNNPVGHVDPDGREFTSAQQEFLHRAFSTPEGRQAFVAMTNHIARSMLLQQPVVRRFANALSRKSLLAAYKKLAAPEVPPLVDVSLKKGNLKVKVAGVKVLRKKRR
ncbi:SpvB/TcaC N-terminal domain-containing protein [Nocardioides terrisoli]|uniref:SpvB/TcaC N-terminal domain-containing protein n=1 Tax=Nocardioides terrisoli TaxID=3388267 RepID=UPI00287BC927|nr:SpvB/TcaC N-terminal domain-containing protein [Nocardioides marmorisolisilvae]